MSSPDRELVVYRYLKSLHTTTFGQSFDVINNTDKAVQWLAEVWDNLEAADKEFSASLNTTNGNAPSETLLTFCEDCGHYTANKLAHVILPANTGTAGTGTLTACQVLQKRNNAK